MVTIQPPTPVPDRLRGQVSIITGAAGNIGLETVRRFLLEGSSVVMVDIDDSKLASAHDLLSSAIPGAADRILCISADVTSETDVRAFVDRTVETHGRLDSVFLCAGLSHGSTPLLDTPVDLYDKVMEVNCRSGKPALSSPTSPSPWSGAHLLSCPSPHHPLSTDRVVPR